MSRPRIQIRPAMPGYSYRCYVGADLDEAGEPIKSSADRVVGGWAPLASQAAEKAEEVFAG